MRTFIAILLVICMAVQGVGCSLVYIDSVPDGYRPSQELKCYDTYCWPILDGVFAVGLSTLGIIGVVQAALMDRCSEDTCSSNKKELLYILSGSVIVSGLLYIYSSLTGVGRAHDCQQAKLAHEAWLKMTPEQQKEFEEQWRKGQGQCTHQAYR